MNLILFELQTLAEIDRRLHKQSMRLDASVDDAWEQATYHADCSVPVIQTLVCDEKTSRPLHRVSVNYQVTLLHANRPRRDHSPVWRIFVLAPYDS